MIKFGSSSVTDIQEEVQDLWEIMMTKISDIPNISKEQISRIYNDTIIDLNAVEDYIKKRLEM
jgi:hypothetical protein